MYELFGVGYWVYVGVEWGVYWLRSYCKLKTVNVWVFGGRVLGIR